MDTRWKSFLNQLMKLLKTNKRNWISAIALLMGIGVLYIPLYNVGEYSTKVVWIFGAIGNLLLGAGLYQWFNYFLLRISKKWQIADQDFYLQWKKKWRTMQRNILIAAGIALVFAAFWFAFQKTWLYMYGMGYWNYAAGYLAIATVFLQAGMLEICLIRFMQDVLEKHMAGMEEISRERLAAAVEIERQSIEKAAKSDQLRVDLISNVSHDLKTPLTSMVGYIELMKKEDLSDVTRDYVEVISDKAEKLKGMIDSLFSLAKASSGNIQFEEEIVELNMLIEQIFADMHDRIEDSGLEFVQVLTDEDTRLLSDNLYLYRICQNLIENAVKYAAKGTRVFVKTLLREGSPTGSEEKKVCLEITNTAAYMMNFDKAEIVERFARGDKARSSEGNGLGLAIVSTYTNALGGAFDIHIDCDQFKAILEFPRHIYGEMEAETETEAGIETASKAEAEEG